MRYEIVTETWPPEVNGVALTVQNMAEGLRARGHDVTINRPRQATDGAIEPGTVLLRGASLPGYGSLKFGFPSSRKLSKRWRATPPDAIYVATEGPLGWSALSAARRLGIPVATGFHTRFDRYMQDYGAPLLATVALRWLRNFHRRADTVLVPTQELADFLAQEGVANVRLLRRAVDTRQFDPAKRDWNLRAAWGAGPGTVVVLYLGRIAAEKNLDLSIRAFREVKARGVDARFVWVGDGPERIRIEAQNPDFVFCGTRRGDDLARHFASADLFFFPSLSETFGNVTLEALASGVPPIAFNYGAAHEHIKDGSNGAAVDGDDQQAFIDACVRLGSDPALRDSMAVAARRSVSALRPENVASDFDDILQRLACDRRKNASLAAA